MGGCISPVGCEESRGDGAKLRLGTRYRGETSHSREVRRQAAWVMMLRKGESRPRQVRLLEEEEEEADEGEVFANSWVDTQALAGEARVQVWAMGDQGL